MRRSKFPSITGTVSPEDLKEVSSSSPADTEPQLHFVSDIGFSLAFGPVKIGWIAMCFVISFAQCFDSDAPKRQISGVSVCFVAVFYALLCYCFFVYMIINNFQIFLTYIDLRYQLQAHQLWDARVGWLFWCLLASHLRTNTMH